MVNPRAIHRRQVQVEAVRALDLEVVPAFILSVFPGPRSVHLNTWEESKFRALSTSSLLSSVLDLVVMAPLTHPSIKGA